MIETDPQVVLNYLSPKDIKAVLKLNNPIQNMMISFKIKTTNPDLFLVNPSKGFLHYKKIKQVYISINKQHTKQEVQDIVLKEKFLIEYILIPDKMKQEQLEAQWKIQQKKQGGIKRHKLRIKFQFQRMKASDIIFEEEDKRESQQTLLRSAYSKSGEVINQQKQQQNLGNQNKQTKSQNPPYIIRPQDEKQKTQQKISKDPTQTNVRHPNNNFKLIKMAFLFAIIIIVLLSIQSAFRNKSEASFQDGSQSEQKTKQPTVN